MLTKRESGTLAQTVMDNMSNRWTEFEDCTGKIHAITSEEMCMSNEITELQAELANIRQAKDELDASLSKLNEENANLKSQLDTLITKLKAVAMILRG